MDRRIDRSAREAVIAGPDRTVVAVAKPSAFS